MTQSYGSVVVGVSSDPKTFTVTNTGNAASGSVNATVGGDFAITNNTCGGSLGSGDNCTIDVVFTPSQASPRSSQLSVSASPGGTVSSSLTGTGTTAGKLSISPGTQPFGSIVVGSSTAAQTFTITNTGSSTTGTITLTTQGQNPSDFTETDTCNGQTLAAGATCTITATFAPSLTSVGARSAQFDVTASPGGDVTGNVTGTGLAQAQVQINPTSQDFGSVIKGQSSNNNSFTVKNIGGVDTGVLAASVTGTNGTDFTIASNTCTATLAPNATCTVLVKFSPTTTAAETAILNVAGTPGGTGTSTLTGTGVPPGNLQFNPTSFAFPDTVVGQNSTAEVFSVTNTGGASLTGLVAALGGNDPSQFKLVAGGNSCTGTLGAGATCTVAVTSSPDAGGSHTATLQVSSGGNIASAALSGKALTAAKLQINPTSNDFGSVGVGLTSTVNPTFTVTNIGDQTSSAVSVAVGGTNATQFAITASTCTGTLASQASCQVTVAFSPTSPGNKDANVQATAATGGTATATLTGQGNDSQIVISSALANFPVTNIGDTAITQTFTVKNTGNSSSGTINIAAPTGANAADFSQTNNCNILGAGATCTVTVSFKPSTTACDLTLGSCERDASFSVSATPGGSVTQPAVGFAQPRLEVTNPVVVPAQSSAWPTDSFTFPDTIINTTAAPTAQFTVTNNIPGTGTSTLSLGTAPTAPFHVTATTCGATINNAGAGGNTCTVTVQFLPTTKTTSTQTITATIAGGGTANTSAVKLTGTGIDSLVISNPTTSPIDFGTVPVGTASGATVISISNPSGAPLSGSIQSSTTGPFHIVSDGCAGAGQTGGATACTISVIYTPTAVGAQTGTIVVTGNPGGTVTGQLKGTGIAQANLTVSSTNVAFGNVFAGEGSDRSITVTNQASAATSSAVTITQGSGANPDFTLNAGSPQAGDCSLANTTTLAGGASCTIRIHYAAPNAFGNESTAFSVKATTGLSPTTVSVTGTSVSDISIAPGTITNPFAFGAKDAGTVTTQDFTVTNNSNSSITFASAPLTGTTNGLSVTGNTCTTLAKGATCKITVQYAPSVATTAAATLTASFNNGLVTSAGVASTGITGTGLAAASFTVAPTNNYFFGTVIEGQTGTSETFTLSNAANRSAGTVGFSSSNTGNDFVITNNCGTSLASGASCTIVTTFKPSVTGSASPRSASFTAGGQTVNLSGFGAVGGIVTVTPGAVDFGSLVDGSTSATTTVTLQNTAATGTASLSNDTAGTTSGQFAVVAGGTCGASLAAGANCTVNLVFKPVAPGGFTSSTITFGGGAVVGLSGTGLPVAHISFQGCQGTVNNQTVAVGASLSATCTFSNSGGVATNAISATLSGADSGQFSVVNNCAVLQPNSTCTIVTTFAPSTVGTKHATITITASGINTQTQNLTDTAVLEATLGITPSSPVTLTSRAVGSTDGGTTFTINNGGDVPTGQFSISLSNTTDYSFVSNCPTTLNSSLGAGLTCTVTVFFDPASLATGLKTTLTVSETHDGKLSTVSNTLTGNGTSALTANVATQAFGTGSADTLVSTKVLTFTNNSDDSTGLLTTSLSGAGTTDFSIAGNVGSGGGDQCEGTVLAAGSNCTITIDFVPQSTGAKTGTLTVSGTPGNSASVSLTGTGN